MSAWPRPTSRAVFVVGAVMTALAVLGAWREVATLSARETTVTERVPEGARLHGFAPISLGPRGALRVTACAPNGVDPRATLEVGARHIRLTHADALQRRCTAAGWSSTRGSELRVALRFERPAPRGLTLTLRYGGSLGAHNAAPFALILLGVAAMVLAPIAGVRRRAEAIAVTDGADIARGFVRAVAGVILAHVAAALSFSLAGAQGLGMLAAVLTQNVGTILAAAWSVGALERGADVRAVMELVPPRRRELLRAMLVGALLVAIALLVSARVPDAGDTPLGRDLERAPLRYVVVFGGLLAPLSEELFYRGALGRLFARFGRAVVVLVPAAVFTAMHVAQLKGSPLALAPIAAVGVVNGVVRLATGGVVAPWLVHTAYNTALVSSALLAD